MEVSPQKVCEHFVLVLSNKYGSRESKSQQSTFEFDKSFDKFASEDSSTGQIPSEPMAPVHTNGRHKQDQSNSALNGYQRTWWTPCRLFSIISYTISLVFQILAIVGNTSDSAAIRSIYFLKIGLSNIIPESVPNSVSINSIARVVGLHDFYQIGLWSYSKGYDGAGFTYFSPPRALYWFDPVSILSNELLRGATIAVPKEVISTLQIVRLASHWMFASFLTGAVLTCLCVIFAPLAFSYQPRSSHRTKRTIWRSLPITILSSGAAVFTIGATLIATVMFLIFQRKLAGAEDLNITAELGKPMLAFMWIGSGLNSIGWAMQMGTYCGICCYTCRQKAIQQLDDGEWSPQNAFEKIEHDRKIKSRFVSRHRVI